ncbi:MAG: hypothetical protein ACLGH8_13210 [Bacteroidia bacterium]
MEQVSSEIIKLFKERLRYPIITIYLVVVIVYNWDVLSVFFLSERPVELRVGYIKRNFNNDFFYRYWVPLFKASLYFLIVPFVMFYLEKWINSTNRLRRKLRYDRELESLDHQVSRAEKEYIISEEKAGRKSLDALNDRIFELEDQLEQEKKLAIKEKILKEEVIERQNDLYNSLTLEHSKLVLSNQKLQKNFDEVNSMKNTALRAVLDIDMSFKRKYTSSFVEQIYLVLIEISKVGFTFLDLGDFVKNNLSVELNDVMLDEFLLGLRDTGLAYISTDGFIDITEFGKIYIKIHENHLK